MVAVGLAVASLAAFAVVALSSFFMFRLREKESSMDAIGSK